MFKVYRRNCEVKPDMDVPEGTRRFCMGVEYDGARFNGFQRQVSTTNTVQSALEAALTKIALEPVTLVCAGRTDAGVHASAQVVHFDTLAPRPAKAWYLGGNTKLPEAIRILWAKEVDLNFHARFSALDRTYHYFLYSSPSRPSILSRQVAYTRYALDFDAIQEASTVLVGKHDFNALRSSQCQASSSVRTIKAINWRRHGELLVMEITANAFLHHMVRNIVGCLIDVGRGRRDKAWLKGVLAAKDRTLAGATASPCGLYLSEVVYDASFGLPASPKGPLFYSAE